jgi:hypothetical protein
VSHDRQSGSYEEGDSEHWFGCRTAKGRASVPACATLVGCASPSLRSNRQMQLRAAVGYAECLAGVEGVPRLQLSVTSRISAISRLHIRVPSCCHIRAAPASC